jgi:hypothetical protein
VEGGAEGGEFVHRHAELRDDLLGDGFRLAAQVPTRGGEGDDEDALVGLAPSTADETRGLEALEERGERRGLEGERRGEVTGGPPVLTPEREHYEVLRMGQTERLEDRAIQGQHAARGDDECEADLILESEQIRRARRVDGFSIGSGSGCRHDRHSSRI